MRLGFYATLTILAVLAFARPASVDAASFTVNTTDDATDHNPGDGWCRTAALNKICSLRAAIQEANAVSSDDVITLPAGHYTLTIPGAGEDAAATGDLDITDDVRIEGDGAHVTIVDASGLDRVFHVMSTSAALLLEALTVTGGVALDNSSLLAGTGGGVLVENRGALDTVTTRISDNIALRGGGIGVDNGRWLSLLSSEVLRNEIRLDTGIPSLGGGIVFLSGNTASVGISQSTVSHNRCQIETGTDCSAGVNIVVCDVPTSSPAGFSLVNSTVSNNEGVGLRIGTCKSRLNHSTIYGNTGHGIEVTFPGSVSSESSIFAHNGIADCDLTVGAWALTASNISSDASCDLLGSGDQINTDPELYPLGYFSPPSSRIARSHHPRWDSPAVDLGSGGVLEDQDESPRGGDGDADGVDGYDIGSIEVLPCATNVDLLFMNQTITTGIQTACNTLTAAPNVTINGTVAFDARDSVRLGDGFEVTSGSVFSVSIRRDAGAPP